MAARSICALESRTRCSDGYSSVTHAAIAQLRETIRADVIFGEQLLAAFELIRRWMPFHVENLVCAAGEIFAELRGNPGTSACKANALSR